jgi:SNF2 family DNA or RNA helicase
MSINSISYNINNIFPNFYISGNQEFDINVDEINENSPKANHPICNIILKPHQLSLIQRCIDYENENQKLHTFESLGLNVKKSDYFKTNMGVIADRVGSGKSYVILSIILSNSIINRDNTLIKSSGLNNITFFFKDEKPVVKTNMIVVPHNLCSQWENYIKNFKSTLTYKIINKHKGFDAIKDSEDLIENDLLIVTATFFNKVSKIFSDKGVKLQRIFFDEVDSLNIPGCTNIDANFIWFITASYGNVIYPRGFSKHDPIKNKFICTASGIRNSGFIKNVFLDLYTNIPKELTKVLIIKNSELYIETSLQLPELFHHIIKCKTPLTISILNGIVDKNIIDSLNAGDVNTAMSYINSNNKGTEDNIVNLLIDKFNKQINNFQINLRSTDELFYDNELDRENAKSFLIKKIEDLTNKMNMIKERITSGNMCTICYGDIDNKTIVNCCQNTFCFHCIHIWLSNKAVCPMCKSSINSNMLFVVKNDIDEVKEVEEILPENELHDKHDKFKNFKILLEKKKATNSKILIFSGYDYTFNQIIPILNDINVRYDYIKGNGDQIKSVVNKYKKDQIDVLLVNTKNYGTGMNLENTTDIIMFHKFDTQLEQQVIGRAYRMGRELPLNVYYLLHENEIK